MERITKEQFNSILAQYTKAVESFGMLQSGFRLYEGSKANGNPWRLTFVDSGMPAPGTDGGHLGFTRREAYETLSTITRTLAAVAFELEN